VPALAIDAAGAQRSVAGTRRTPAAGELFVNYSFPNSITVYPASADGDTAPLRTISGAATLLAKASGMALGLWP
jgi:hypothetical protein